MDKVTFKVIGNYGDVNFLDYGGKLHVQRCDGYTDELEIVERTSDDDDEHDKYQVYTIVLDRAKTVFSSEERKKHNKNHRRQLQKCNREWFTEKDAIVDITHSMGIDWKDLYRLLMSSNPVKLAAGYSVLVDYYGCYEFDQYPNTFTRDELIERYGCSDTYFLRKEAV